MNSGLKALIFFLSLATTTAFAFQPIQKESGKALGVTRGKPFTSGAVFVNGRFIEPPYTVERWGTGIRINQVPVTGQIVNWSEFLKTQDGVKVETREVAPSAEAQAAAVSSASTVAQESSDALDDLFDDDPKPVKPKSSVRTSAGTRPVATPKSETSYSLDGEFKPNDASKALLKRVNAARTEIDRILRSGGFICFGNSYSRVTGDKRILSRMLTSLPELLQNSEDVNAFRSGVRSANLVYLNEVLCDDLYRNRLDYPKLKRRRERIQSEERWDNLLQEASDPVF